MKMNIKMRLIPNQSRRVQEICFKNGVYWLGFGKVFLKNEFIFINDNLITSTIDKLYFNNHKYEEIDTDMFIRTNGTCEETFKEKSDSYFKQADDYYKKVEDSIGNLIIVELQNKLKKKNEILKKARIKRKNQREELHKLNLKLQKCIGLEEHNKIVDELKKDIDFKNEIIRELESENIEMGKLVNLNKSELGLMGATKDLSICRVEEQQKEIEKLKAVIEYLESKVK